MFRIIYFKIILYIKLKLRIDWFVHTLQFWVRHRLRIIYLCGSARVFACIANWHTSKHNDSYALPHVNMKRTISVSWVFFFDCLFGAGGACAHLLLFWFASIICVLLLTDYCRLFFIHFILSFSQLPNGIYDETKTILRWSWWQFLPKSFGIYRYDFDRM